ncbi:MAG: MaoC family dehydratase N-terminal domain-containing protein [Pseudomonadota bacterium]
MDFSERDFAHWIGRTRVSVDALTDRLVAEFCATLHPHVAAVEGAPPGIFWALCPDMLPATELGPDGHPRLGIVLPDIPFGRRMWAGGEVLFHGDLHVGDGVQRTSEIADIAFKTGRSGRLCFVTVRHRYSVGGKDKVLERQDIVYREPTRAALPAKSPAAPKEGGNGARIELTANPTMLMRYSALTFNGHRIHYDLPYAKNVEGYVGLVVHGPLQATLLLNLAATQLGRLPSRFSYRGLSPLICGDPFVVELGEEGGTLKGRVLASDGRETFGASIDP